jgi:hypothetical protein
MMMCNEEIFSSFYSIFFYSGARELGLFELLLFFSLVFPIGVSPFFFFYQRSQIYYFIFYVYLFSFSYFLSSLIMHRFTHTCS